VSEYASVLAATARTVDSDRVRAAPMPDQPPSAGSAQPPAGGSAHLPAHLVRRLLAGLPSGLVLVAPDGTVPFANPAATAMGVVEAGALAVPSLVALVEATRADGQTRERQIDLPPRAEPPLRKPRPDAESLAVRVRTMPVGDHLAVSRPPAAGRPGTDQTPGDNQTRAAGHIAVILDDVTEARRVEAVRKDFVANVSHELKTPVGALHVLAEAVSAASEDPVAVRRFASRMTHESSRLARLVQEIIDLSRVQGADPPPQPLPVEAAAVIAEAVDRTRLAAEARDIGVVVISDESDQLMVTGDEAQLVTALANLLDNAVAYSPPGTRVIVGVRRNGPLAEISVADEGIGIAEKDLERVFERFYRADPARSRATGGTGLGLAIVKHVASNHGGGVSVWSAEGAGSTFTLRLPVNPPARPSGAGTGTGAGADVGVGPDAPSGATPSPDEA
jgi:two-component system sensor histidine kinase SenX3